MLGGHHDDRTTAPLLTWQGDALLVAWLPLAVLVRGAALAAGLLVAHERGVVLGAAVVLAHGPLGWGDGSTQGGGQQVTWGARTFRMANQK